MLTIFYSFDLVNIVSCFIVLYGIIFTLAIILLYEVTKIRILSIKRIRIFYYLTYFPY